MESPSCLVVAVDLAVRQHGHRSGYRSSRLLGRFDDPIGDLVQAALLQPDLESLGTEELGSLLICGQPDLERLPGRRLRVGDLTRHEQPSGPTETGCPPKYGLSRL